MTPTRDERLRTLEGAVEALSEMEGRLEELTEALKDVALPSLAFDAGDLEEEIGELKARAVERLSDVRPSD